MAIHCLLERRRCSGTCLACCSRECCIIGRRDGLSTCCPMASWQRAHQAHCYSCLPARDTRRHHTSHLQLGHLGIWHPPDLVCCNNCHGNTPESTVYAAVTHRPDHKTRSAVIRQIHRARSPSGTRGSLLVLYPLALWPPLAMQSVPVGEICVLRHMNRQRLLSLLLLLPSMLHACAQWVFPRRTHPRPVAGCRCLPALAVLRDCGWSGSIRVDDRPPINHGTLAPLSH